MSSVLSLGEVLFLELKPPWMQWVKAAVSYLSQIHRAVSTTLIIFIIIIYIVYNPTSVHLCQLDLGFIIYIF